MSRKSIALLLVASLAHAYGVSGQHAAARDLIERLDELGTSRHVSSYYRALAHLGVGDVDLVFPALERAALERDPGLTYVSVEPQFESVRSDARFPRCFGESASPPDAFFDTTIPASFASDPQ